ncbi:hypothetical protein [uncultured Methanolobus sp.]|uniref:hypothetical protein n=1 Tax=uncultured Methanolobus sp. TaxID=218300 RepID=UPI002AAB8F23|nr:hypothetical protein [uncultured Methanolobus sp.]
MCNRKDNSENHSLDKSTFLKVDNSTHPNVDNSINIDEDFPPIRNKDIFIFPDKDISTSRNEEIRKDKITGLVVVYNQDTNKIRQIPLIVSYHGNPKQCPYILTSDKIWGIIPVTGAYHVHTSDNDGKRVDIGYEFEGATYPNWEDHRIDVLNNTVVGPQYVPMD